VRNRLIVSKPVEFQKLFHPLAAGVAAAGGLRGPFRVCGRLGGQQLQALQGNDAGRCSDIISEKLRAAPRPVLSVVSFSRRRAVRLDNSARVENALVDLHARLVELRGKRPQAGFQKITGGLVVGKIHKVGEVPAIAAVTQQGLGPAAGVQVSVDRHAHLLRRRFLRVGRGDPRGAIRIDVDQEQPPAQDVGIFGGEIGAFPQAVVGSGQ
jgi:hypothetical protein